MHENHRVSLPVHLAVNPQVSNLAEHAFSSPGLASAGGAHGAYAALAALSPRAMSSMDRLLLG